MEISVTDNEHKIAAIRNLLFGKEIANLTALIRSTEKSLLISQLQIKEEVDIKLQDILHEFHLTNERVTQLESDLAMQIDRSDQFVEESRCHRIIVKNKIERLVDQLKQLEVQIDRDLQKLTESIRIDLGSLTDEIETGLARVGRESTAREQLGALLIEMGAAIQDSSDEEQEDRLSPEIVLTR